MKMLFFEVNEEQKLSFKKAFPHDELYCFEYPLSLTTVPTEHNDAQLISIFLNSKITGEIVDKFPKLEAIFSRTTGSDHIDCQVTQKKNISIYTLPRYATQAVAEYTFALILALMRKIMIACGTNNESKKYDILIGSELAHKTIGVIGFGRIGSAVAQIAHGFSMNVLVYDPCCSSSLMKDVALVSLQELLQQSDVVTLHVPLTKTTHHMLNRESMKYCKQGAYLINTARGGIIETAALLEALNSKRLAGAALDVLEEEFFHFASRGTCSFSNNNSRARCNDYREYYSYATSSGAQLLPIMHSIPMKRCSALLLK